MIHIWRQLCYIPVWFCQNSHMCPASSCSPDHVCHAAAATFDKAIRETLESVIGSPLTDWSWLKASLLSNWSGINLCCAVLHAPAAFTSSTSRSVCQIGGMLGQSSTLLGNLISAIPALPTAASHPEWQTLEDIDVPLYQWHLSATIDKVVQLGLLSTASFVCE